MLMQKDKDAGLFLGDEETILRANGASLLAGLVRSTPVPMTPV